MKLHLLATVTAAISLTRAWSFAHCLLVPTCSASHVMHDPSLHPNLAAALQEATEAGVLAATWRKKATEAAQKVSTYTANMLHLFTYSLDFTGCWGHYRLLGPTVTILTNILQ